MPRYRVISETAVVNSIVYHRGAEVTSSSWPTVHMEPLDEDARRIAAYYLKRRSAPGLPPSPFSAAFGRFYLPATLPDVPSRKISGWVKDDAASPGMPQYTVNSSRTELTGRTLMAGDRFFFVGWPSFWFVPINDEARRVVDYLAEHGDNPKRPSSPWDWFSRSVFLPDLPPIDTSYRPGESVLRSFTPTRQPEPRITPQLRDPARAVQGARSRHWGEFKS